MPLGIEKDIDLQVIASRTVGDFDVTNPLFYNDTDTISVSGTGGYTLQVWTPLTDSWVTTSVTGTASSTLTELDLSSVVFPSPYIRFTSDGFITVTVQTSIKVIQAPPLGGGQALEPPASSLSIAASPTTLQEGSSSTVTLIRSGDLTDPVTASLRYSGTYPSTDFPASVSIPADQASTTFSLATADDDLIQPDRTLTVSLSSSLNYSVVSPSSATITVQSEDVAKPTVSLSRSAATVAEGSTATFTITRTVNTAGALTVNLSTAGTATPGSDYTAFPASASFADGESTKTVLLSTIDDTDIESDETVILSINPSSLYDVGTSTQTITITSEDVPTAEFDLLNESGIEFWTDTTDTSDITITDGGISAWDGQVSGRVFTQNNPDDRPTLVGGGVEINIDSHLSIDNRLGFAESGMKALIVAVLNVDRFGNSRRLVTIGEPATGSQDGALIITASRAGVSIMGSSGDTENDYSGLSESNVRYLMSFVVDNTTFSYYLNGVLQSPSSTTVGTKTVGNSVDRVSISDLNGSFSGRIFSVAAFSQVTDDTRLKAEGELAHLHGLEGDLPSGHPYKTSPPA